MNLGRHRWIQGVRQLWRARCLRAQGAVAGRKLQLGSGIMAAQGWREGRPGVVEVATGCWLETGVVLEAFGGKIVLEENVFLGPYAVVYGHGGVTIGAQSLISMHCCILSSNHTLAPLGIDIRSQPDVLRPTRIGRDVWLGARVTVLGGVSIGDGCIVGAGSLVTKDLPSGAIAYGSPAQVKRFRAAPGS